MPGPPPKRAAVRRNDPKKDFRVLTGRKGDVPAWPLLPDVERTALLEVQRDRIANLQVEIEGTEDGRTKGRLTRELNKLEIASATLALQIEQAVDMEKSMWAAEWEKPQAELWEEAHAHRAVALWVRLQIKGEQGDLRAAAEARQLSDRLGGTPLALARLRADIEQAEKAVAEGERRRSKPEPKPAPKKKPDDPRGFLSSVS